MCRFRCGQQMCIRDRYKATIAKLKAEYRGKVDILCGIEWDIRCV